MDERPHRASNKDKKPEARPAKRPVMRRDALSVRPDITNGVGKKRIGPLKGMKIGGANKNKSPEENKIDKEELKKTAKNVGRVSLKVLTWAANILLTVLLIGIITGTIVGGAFLLYVKNYIDPDMTSFELMTVDQNQTTHIYYMDYSDRLNRIGDPVEIEGQRLYASENRMWVSFTQLPDNLVNAFVSIEDQRFWDHGGVDWKRTVAATFSFLTGGDHYGGSTITQQLIKNVTGDDEVTIQRKVQEILRALELEDTKSKEEILEMYLNTIFLSQRCYGVSSAAYTYFGKSVEELSLVECAALAAIPQYPTAYDPFQNPENNTERRNAVLLKMYQLEKISKEEYEEAIATELVLNTDIVEIQQTTTSWYTDAVIDEAIDLLTDALNITSETASQMIYTGGLNIYTVMDPDVQKIVEDIYKDDANFSSVNDGVQPESAMVIIDPSTGDVVALAGGRGEKTQSRLLNYATQTTRSPGSSIKPVSVYGPAVELGLVNYATVLDDNPVLYKDDGVGWPANFPAGYRGLTTLNDAITRSVNTIAVRVLQLLTPQTSFDFVHNKLGMHSVIERRELTGGTVITDIDYSALALGGMNYGVTVEEITAAYQALANKGIYSGYRTVLRIEDSEGNLIVENSDEATVVFSEQTSSLMTMMLQNVVTSGTGARATLKKTVDTAGKTGTTSNDNDRWFIGYTPYYVAGAWFGYEMPSSLSRFTSNPALLIWDKVMVAVHDMALTKAGERGEVTKSFTLANGIVTASYCRYSGMLPGQNCPEDCRQVGYFTNSTKPSKVCTYHQPEATTAPQTTATAPQTTATTPQTTATAPQTTATASQTAATAPQTTATTPQTTATAPQTGTQADPKISE